MCNADVSFDVVLRVIDVMLLLFGRRSRV